MDQKLSHSRFGIISFCVGALNIMILIYALLQIAKWIMGDPELMQNPQAIEGMQISSSTYNLFLAAFVLQIIGLITGLFGLFEKLKKRTFPVIGSALNGLLVFASILKLNVF